MAEIYVPTSAERQLVLGVLAGSNPSGRCADSCGDSCGGSCSCSDDCGACSDCSCRCDD